MTKYFAVQLANDGFRVNYISPGGIFNPDNPQSEYFVNQYSARNPMGRLGDSNELSGPALFLSSNSFSYITGHNVVVDGGMTYW